MNKIILRYGVLLGISSIIFYLIDCYIFERQLNSKFRAIFLFILFVGIPVLCSKKVKKSLDNVATFSEMFKSIFLCFVIGLFIDEVYNICSFIINPDSIILTTINTNPFADKEELAMGQYIQLRSILEMENYYLNSFINIFLVVLIYLILAVILSLFIRTKTTTITPQPQT